jgi:hypothetical protein
MRPQTRRDTERHAVTYTLTLPRPTKTCGQRGRLQIGQRRRQDRLRLLLKAPPPRRAVIGRSEGLQAHRDPQGDLLTAWQQTLLDNLDDPITQAPSSDRVDAGQRVAPVFRVQGL